jgi:L-lactate utilization protein LutC
VVTRRLSLIAGLEKAYAKAISAYSHRKNVTGIDLGYKYIGSDQQRTEQLSIRIHVNEKIQESALEAAELFPKEIDGVPVGVAEYGVAYLVSEIFLNLK